MKQLFLSLALILGGFTMMNAQEFGAKAGLNFSNFGADANSDGTTSFAIGAFGRFDLPADKFAIQAEALFSSEGADNASVSYARLLGLADYTVAAGFSLQAGPQVGVVVSAEEDVDDFLKSVDFGVALGAQYELDSLPLHISARYQLGLANISEQPESEFDDFEGFEVPDIKITQGTFQIAVGYSF